MSALGQKQTCAMQTVMSALPPKRTLKPLQNDVCFVPSELARAFFTFAALVGAAMCSAFKCGTRGRWP